MERAGKVEQLENQLRAKDGVAKKPGSGGEGEVRVGGRVMIRTNFITC